jgi:DNA polymerase-3 subunit epsilon
MLPTKLAFVDVETTGLYPNHDRVIEIGIIRVEDGKIVDTYSSLINPDRHLPTFIQGHTNISNTMVKKAPKFEAIESRVSELLDDAVFVAHNVMFDYNFLRYEMARLDRGFEMPNLCTVRLSRRLYPQLRSHSLDSLIRTFRFPCENRHRALDDVAVLWQFYQQVLDGFPPERILPSFSNLSYNR